MSTVLLYTVHGLVLVFILGSRFATTNEVLLSEINFDLNCRHLDDDALLRLIKALITLSNESLEVAYNNREPSLVCVEPNDIGF